jgi:uncharacterized repeat protein (TIGR01451 family)
MRKTLFIALALFAVSRVAAADVDVSIDVDASAEQVLSGSNITYTIAVTNDDSDPASPFTVVDTLPAETTLVSCSATGGGVCGGSSISFASLDGGASATITIVANVNCPVHDQTDITNAAEIQPVTPDPDADEFENDSVTVTVLNPPPQVVDVSATPSVLWPPNHKFVDVAVGYTIIDNCGPVTVALSVASNEPVNGTGDGNTAPDWQVVSDHRVRLRAERAGTGTGRIYAITIAATDSAGQSGSATVAVSVPHDN